VGPGSGIFVAMTLRIEGLVRFHNHVRTLLAGGVEGKERDDLLAHIPRFLRSVEEICARHGVTPADLPAPSRNAYRSLASIDLDHLPPPKPGGPKPPRVVRLAGIVSTAEWLGRRMWREKERLLASESERELFSGEICMHLVEIEDLCLAANADPSALAPRTRLLYAWMRFLTTEGVLARHFAALVDIALEIGPLPVEVHLLGVRSLWRRAVRAGRTLFVASEGFIDAPPEVLRGLAGLARGDRRGTAAAEAVRSWALTDGFARVIRGMDAEVGGGDSPRGRHHDLGASFERVNAAYFDGRLSRPVLCFGQVPTSRKLAHYEPAGHRVLFSPLLDDPSVSELAIDSLMHHELLHAVFGVGSKNGRHVLHGPDFRRAERQFRGCEEAHRQIAAFLRRRGRGRD
jgi:hypothetical protein